MNRLFFAICMMMTISPAQAYLGPGMGVGTIGVILGILGAFFLAVFAVIWYPFKRMMKRRKAQKEASREKNFGHDDRKNG